jgi:hypothetical protein
MITALQDLLSLSETATAAAQTETAPRKSPFH